MKNKNFFLSNEPYNTFRTQKLMNVKVFKAHTAKNNGFSKIFKPVHPQRVFFFHRINFPSFCLQKKTVGTFNFLSSPITTLKSNTADYSIVPSRVGSPLCDKNKFREPQKIFIWLTLVSELIFVTYWRPNSTRNYVLISRKALPFYADSGSILTSKNAVSTVYFFRRFLSTKKESWYLKNHSTIIHHLKNQLPVNNYTVFFLNLSEFPVFCGRSTFFC